MPNQSDIHAFARFNLHPMLLDAVNKAGYSQPTPIQGRSIPKIIEGRDVLASAETGSGKTVAYVLPLLQALLEQRTEEGPYAAKGHHIRALILVPTRELALQVSGVVADLGIYMRPAVRCVSVYGGVPVEENIATLQGGVEVLVATPARLLTLIEERGVVFNKLRTLVLDEVDRLISKDFQDEVEAILRHLPNSRQNLFFTATFPESIRGLVRNVLDNPEVVNVPPRAQVIISQHVLMVNLRDKLAITDYLLKENDWKQVLIFATTKKACDALVDNLQALKVDVVGLHGNIEAGAREGALAQFKAGKVRVLVATDIAARGLDIPALDCVINYELPNPITNYTHRVGRTGRALKEGQVINLVAHHEVGHFKAIEKHEGMRCMREELEGFEPDKVAPPLPPRSKPKKVVGKKRKAAGKVKKKAKRIKKAFGSPAATHKRNDVKPS